MPPISRQRSPTASFGCDPCPRHFTLAHVVCQPLFHAHPCSIPSPFHCSIPKVSLEDILCQVAATSNGGTDFKRSQAGVVAGKQCSILTNNAIALRSFVKLTDKSYLRLNQILLWITGMGSAAAMAGERCLILTSNVFGL